MKCLIFFMLNVMNVKILSFQKVSEGELYSLTHHSKLVWLLNELQKLHKKHIKSVMKVGHTLSIYFLLFSFKQQPFNLFFSLFFYLKRDASSESSRLIIESLVTSLWLSDRLIINVPFTNSKKSPGRFDICCSRQGGENPADKAHQGGWEDVLLK